MSDSASNGNVEDVLASIRRLVSEQKRPSRGTGTGIGTGTTSGDPAGATPGENADPNADPLALDKTPPGDRLVLTPSQRVGDGAEPSGGGAVPEDWQDDAHEETAAAEPEDARARDVWTDAPWLGRAPWDPGPELSGDTGAQDRDDAPAMQPAGPQSGSSTDAEDDGAVTQADTDLDTSDEHGAEPAEAGFVEDAEPDASDELTRVLRLDQSVRVPDDARDGKAGADTADPDPAAAGHTESQAADAPATDAGSDETVEARGSADGVNAGGPSSPGEQAASVVAQDEAEIDDGAADSDAQRQVRLDNALDAKLFALEAAIARRRDDLGPDDAEAETGPHGADVEDGTGTTDAAPSAPFVLEPENRSDGVPAGGDEVGSEVGTSVLAPTTGVPGHRLDQDALRDLVDSIVREELQGALGERITRNVRKLVRREILRALESKAFE